MNMTLCLIAAALFTAGSARAEIASDLTSDNRTYLYALDGDDVVRTKCDADAIVFDHASCAALARRVPVHQLFAASAASFGGDLPALQARITEAKTGLDRIDARLAEGLATPPGADTTALRAQIEQLTHALASAGVSVRELADQVARLDEAMAQGDVVSEQQLRITRGHYAEAVGREGAVAAQLQDARKAYIDAAATTPDSTFQGLLRDRERLMEAFSKGLSALNDEVEEAVNLATLFTRLADPGFVYVHLLYDRNYEDSFHVLCGHDYPRCYAQNDNFDNIFRRIDKAGRQFHGTVDTSNHTVTTVIARDDGISEFRCNFDVTADFDNPCDARLRIKGPRGFDLTVNANDTSGYGFTATPFSRYGNVSDELWHTLIGAPSAGTWTVTFFCATGAARTITEAACDAVVERRELWNEYSSCPSLSPNLTPAPCNL